MDDTFTYKFQGARKSSAAALRALVENSNDLSTARLAGTVAANETTKADG